MTNNEKAATSIGWRPKTPCFNQSLDNESCSACGTGIGMVAGPRVPPHYVAAPDMSKPENYMRALEGLPRDYEWALFRGECRIREVSRLWAMASRGATPAAALAALYDAEHPE